MRRRVTSKFKQQQQQQPLPGNQQSTHRRRHRHRNPRANERLGSWCILLSAVVHYVQTRSRLTLSGCSAFLLGVGDAIFSGWSINPDNSDRSPPVGYNGQAHKYSPQKCPPLPVGKICTPSNTGFLGPTAACHPNGISIGSAVCTAFLRSFHQMNNSISAY